MFIDWVSTEGKMGEMKTERKKKKEKTRHPSLYTTADYQDTLRQVDNQQVFDH
jgi:hypothetical protein